MDEKMDAEKKLLAIKKDVRSLLISSPVGLSVQGLLDDYRSMLGKHLPFQELGYGSALEMIKHMPDVVVPIFRAGGVMYLKAVADGSTKHIRRLVEEQKRTGKISRIRKPVSEAVRRPVSQPAVPSVIRVKIKEMMKSYSEGLAADMFGTAYIRRFGLEIKYESLGFPSLKKFLESCADIVEIVEKNQNGITTVTLYPRKSPSDKNVNSAQSSKISKKQTAPSRNQLKSCANSVLDNQKDKDFKSMLPKSTLPNSRNHINRCTSGSNCPPQSLMDLEIEYEERPSLLPKNVTATAKDPVIKTKSGVSTEMKKDLSSLLADKKNGIWLARMPFEYKKKFSKDLDFQAVGYLSLIEMFGSMPDMIKIERPVRNGDWLLTGIQKVAKISHEDPLPQNAVTHAGKYMKVSHPMQGQIRTFIVHISNPGSFCFHWCDKKKELDELMASMKSFYSNVASQMFLLPSGLRNVGQVCCAIYEEDEEWYRAEITKVISEREVEVFYVDYGNLATVETSNVRLLRKDFIDLPSMAIEGCLANILPKGMLTWSVEAGKKFFELANDRVLIGNISGRTKQSVLLHLIDTNNNQQVHINDSLVIQGFAIYQNAVVPNICPVSPLQTPCYQPDFPLNAGILQQGLASLDTATAAALLPLLFGPLQQGQELTNRQCPAFTQPDLTSLFSNMVAGNMLLPAMQNLNTESPFQRTQQHGSVDAKFPFKSQVANPVKVDESNLDSFIESVNFELDGEISDNKANEDEEIEISDSMVCCVKIRRLLIPEPYIVHAINVEEIPYVSSGEIAALFWHGDILRSMLRRENAAVEKIVIPLDENQELSEELLENDVGGVCDANGMKSFITVYELESLPKILDLFKHKSAELKEMVAKEVSQYKNNPTNYWLTGISDGDGSSEEIEDDSESLELELEELRLLLQAMQFRRKRLVNALMNKSPSPSAVDELRSVEEEIERIRKKVQAKEGITK